MSGLFDSIDDVVRDYAEGKFVIVLDDEDRENEGDLLIAASKVTPEQMAFLIRHSRYVPLFSHLQWICVHCLDAGAS